MFEKKLGNRVEPSITLHGTPRGSPHGTPYATPRGSPHGTPSRIPISISHRRHSSSCNASDVILRETTLTKIKITSPETTTQGTSLDTPTGHFILSNSWVICVMFRFFGFYPFKRSGNSELIPISKCRYWVMNIPSIVILAFSSILHNPKIMQNISDKCLNYTSGL